MVSNKTLEFIAGLGSGAWLKVELRDGSEFEARLRFAGDTHVFVGDEELEEEEREIPFDLIRDISWFIRTEGPE